jgi:hypothetical protein
MDKNVRIGAGGVAQVVECLSYKHEALNSNPMLPKEKIKVRIASSEVANS